jgi:SAM-dependent methyltransferase
MFDDLQKRHAQFLGQAQWTNSIRSHLINRCGITSEQRCLEVGCGTGVILQEWEQRLGPAYGVDHHLPSLQFAAPLLQSRLAAADALNLPFADNSFECIFSHYFFLWVKSPLQVLMELKRCLKPGGWLLIFAEPDYGGRIDFPGELEIIKSIQLAALTKMGADPSIGRKLKGMLTNSGFHAQYGGILGSEWQETALENLNQSTDIENILYDAPHSGMNINLEQLAEMNQYAVLDGSRMTYVPTFFFCAQK